jgi:hypothetical protein
MSIHRSYFSRNNTIIYNNCTNTGQNPVTELYFGTNPNSIAPKGYTRFIFDLDLEPLIDKITGTTISTGCTTAMTHTLRMTNTSAFDKELLNILDSSGRRRATSFDLILFRIPQIAACTISGNPIPTPIDPCDPIIPNPTAITTCIYDQGLALWDEGVGYDYNNFSTSLNSTQGASVPLYEPEDKSYSQRPSNWLKRTTLDYWSEPGIYNNENNGNINYSAITIVNIQHFEFGNEDIEFDMTNEINSIINGSLTGVTGWGIAFKPELENLTGLSENYSVGFFTRHTQTFYEPYLETVYDDLIQDDRNNFVQYRQNKLYLYAYVNGDYVNFDNNPVVSILDTNGDPISGYMGLTTCLITKGIYEVTIPSITGITTPCQYTDVWSNIAINGIPLPNVENDLIIKPYGSYFNIGTESKEPAILGFDFYGIKQDEKILNTDVRKIGVIVKKAYTTQQLLTDVEVYYRVYVREGQTEVQVQDWTLVNRTPNEYYFIFDMRDKLPNEYFVDLKVNTSGEKDTYKRAIKFQIVNKK